MGTTFNKKTGLLFVKTALIYGIVYVGTNKINTARNDHFELFFDWELNIPLIPFFIIFYLITFPLALLPIKLLNYEEQVKASRSIILSTFIGGAIFLLIPTNLGFVRGAENLGIFNIAYKMLWFFDDPHNLFPSQHIAVSYLLIMPCLKKINIFQKSLLVILFLLISFSIILVHQHHLLDLFAGFFLGVTCYYIINKYKKA